MRSLGRFFDDLAKPQQRVNAAARHRLLFVAAVLAAGAALLVASTTAGSAAGARKGGTLRLSAPADVDSVDPAIGYFPRAWMLSYATCAKLFNYPDAQGAAGTQLLPEVVDRETVSGNRRTYTFELKRTFRFHTGDPVTARSFADALNRVAQPKLDSPATAYMHEIVGADAVISGRAKTISGVRVLGRYRLQIGLTRPVGDFTARLTMPFFCPILPTTPPDTEIVTDPPGSGPYYVAERIVNHRIVLKRNPYYGGGRPANVDEVVVTIDELDDCLRAIERAAIDYCYLGGGLSTGALIRDLEKTHGINRPGGRFFVSPYLATSFVAFNHDRAVFSGPGQIPLKKAINYAIDRPELARQLGYLSANRTDQLLPRGLARAESIYPRAGADAVEARRLYARARIRPTTLVLYANSLSASVAQAKILVYNLRQIGIAVEVKYFDVGVLPEKLATSGEPYDLALSGWVADYADPAGFFGPTLNRRSGHGVNLDDPRINARIEAANRLTGGARHTAWVNLDIDMMRDDPPWAPIVHPQTRTFVSRSVDCVIGHPLYVFDIAAACKR